MSNGKIQHKIQNPLTYGRQTKARFAAPLLKTRSMGCQDPITGLHRSDVGAKKVAYQIPKGAMWLNEKGQPVYPVGPLKRVKIQ